MKILKFLGIRPSYDFFGEISPIKDYMYKRLLYISRLNSRDFRSFFTRSGHPFWEIWIGWTNRYSSNICRISSRNLGHIRKSVEIISVKIPVYFCISIYFQFESIFMVFLEWMKFSMMKKHYLIVLVLQNWKNLRLVFDLKISSLALGRLLIGLIHKPMKFTKT